MILCFSVFSPIAYGIHFWNIYSKVYAIRYSWEMINLIWIFALEKMNGNANIGALSSTTSSANRSVFF